MSIHACRVHLRLNTDLVSTFLPNSPQFHPVAALSALLSMQNRQLIIQPTLLRIIPAAVSIFSPRKLYHLLRHSGPLHPATFPKTLLFASHHERLDRFRNNPSRHGLHALKFILRGSNNPLYFVLSPLCGCGPVIIRVGKVVPR